MWFLLLLCIVCAVATAAEDVHGVLEQAGGLDLDPDHTQLLVKYAKKLQRDQQEQQREGGGVGPILARLDLGSLAPAFAANNIRRREDILLLEEEHMIKYLGMADLASRLRLLGYIKQEKMGVRYPSSRPAEGEQLADRAKFAAMFSDMLHAHEQKQKGRDAAREETAAMVAELIEQNNQKLLAQMAAMVAEANYPSTTVVRQHQTGQQRRLQSNNQETAANLESTSMWVEEDGAKVCFGGDAAVNLHRPANGTSARLR